MTLWEHFNEVYIKESGMQSAPFIHKEYVWSVWESHGFTEQDLVLVLRYLRREINKGERKPACMILRNLIERPENFEQELCLAKEAALAKKPETPKQAILRATGRPDEAEKPALSAREIMERDAHVAQLLKQFRESVQ